VGGLGPHGHRGGQPTSSDQQSAIIQQMCAASRTGKLTELDEVPGKCFEVVLETLGLNWVLPHQDTQNRLRSLDPSLDTVCRTRGDEQDTDSSTSPRSTRTKVFT
jgi:hypothetical protein